MDKATASIYRSSPYEHRLELFSWANSNLQRIANIFFCFVFLNWHYERNMVKCQKPFSWLKTAMRVRPRWTSAVLQSSVVTSCTNALQLFITFCKTMRANAPDWLVPSFKSPPCVATPLGFSTASLSFFFPLLFFSCAHGASSRCARARTRRWQNLWHPGWQTAADACLERTC